MSKAILLTLLFHIKITTSEVTTRDYSSRNVVTYDDDVILESLPVFFFIFAGLAVGVAIRALVRILNIPIPYRVVLLFVGCIVGTFSRHYKFVKSFTTITQVHPVYIFVTFMPIIIFKTAFCIDPHTFLRSWNQMFFLAVPGIILTSCFTGIIMMTVLSDFDWMYSMGILFGAVCSSIYPIEIVLLLKEISNAKYLNTLIEGEAMLGECTVIIIYEIVTGVIDETVTTWYHVLTVFCRFALGGIVCGLVCGKIVSWIMGIMYTDPGNTSIVTMVAAFLSFYIASDLLYVSGILTVAVVGILASAGRTSLSGEAEKFLFYFWDMIAYIANALIFFMVGVIVTEELSDYLTFKHLAFVFVTYTVVTVSRLLNYIIMAPIITRISYGLSLREMTVAVWGGLRGPLPLVLALLSYRSKELNVLGTEMFIHVVALVVLTLLINAPTMPLMLRLLGLSEISVARKANMNNCMRFLQNRRDRTISMLKMDRFLADANWPLVHSTTILKHPYRINLSDSDDEDDDDDYMGYRVTRCPDCLKEIPNKPTYKEVLEMTREARLRILKAKKISYIRQYENGMLSKEGIRILTQAAEVAMDTPEAVIELDGLHKYFQRQGFVHYTRRRLLAIFFKKAESNIKPPRKYGRRICYRVIMHRTFDYFIYICIILNIIPICVEIITSPQSGSNLSLTIKVANTIFFFIYLLEFILKIYGYSWVYVCKHGFKTYFKSYWNIFDFVILCAALIDLIMDYMDVFLNTFNKTESQTSKITLIARSLRIIRLIRLLRLCKVTYPRLIKYCDSKIDKYLAFAYDVGKGFVTGEEEVSDMLVQMIDNKSIREDCRLRMEADRLAITKELGLVQKDRPWIAITVKTKQAIRATLNSIGESIAELKVSGWVDDAEYAKLMESLEERLKYLRRKIKSVQPSPPRVLFKEVPWLEDEQIADYLYENVHTKIFDEGEVLCKEGEMADGVYIIVTGLFKLTYMPQDATLTRLKEYGALPILDYISSTRFDEKVEDYIVSGNSIGELSFLTGRPYDCTIVADTASQVYVLKHEILRNAFEKNPDPITGLESRMWKFITVRLATSILMDIPAYQSVTQSKIRIQLERAFVPNLSNYKIFGVNDMMQDIILIEGIIVDYNTRDCYIGPCYIPRTVQKIVLPKSSHIAIETTVETKLLIIPARDIDEFDIMQGEEEISELVSTNSSKCLHHIIQNRSSRLRRRKKRQTMFGVTRRYITYGEPSHSSTQSVYLTRSRMTTPSVNDETELRTIRMSQQDDNVYITNEKDSLSKSEKQSIRKISNDNRDLPLNFVKRTLENYTNQNGSATKTRSDIKHRFKDTNSYNASASPKSITKTSDDKDPQSKISDFNISRENVAKSRVQENQTDNQKLKHNLDTKDSVFLSSNKVENGTFKKTEANLNEDAETYQFQNEKDEEEIISAIYTFRNLSTEVSDGDEVTTKEEIKKDIANNRTNKVSERSYKSLKSSNKRTSKELDRTKHKTTDVIQEMKDTQRGPHDKEILKSKSSTHSREQKLKSSTEHVPSTASTDATSLKNFNHLNSKQKDSKRKSTLNETEAQTEKYNKTKRLLKERNFANENTKSTNAARKAVIDKIRTLEEVSETDSDTSENSKFKKREGNKKI